jgi:dihydrofolate synthase/folylpolyglutamate synthase
MLFIESSKRLGSKPGLERVARLCELLGHPQDAVPAVHIAGTNGKGSTAAMIASTLEAAGYRTGLYTSPYVEDVRECMQADGGNITREAFASLVSAVKGPAERMAREGDAPTEFEMETAMAFLWFRQAGCNAMVIEAGLGGRLDATNVLKSPLASVLTSISLDHMSFLGGTVAEIAAEKCGILKPGGLAVSYPLQPAEALEVIRNRAEAAGNGLALPDLGALRIARAGLNGTDIEYKGLALRVPFIGRHQVYNAITAAETTLALRGRCGFAVPDRCIGEGIRNARMPLRQEIVSRKPLILLDGAHNPDGLAALAETMRALIAPRRTAVVMGMLADKDYMRSVALIAPLCGRFVASRPAGPRAPLESGMLAGCARAYCSDATAEDDHEKALARALEYAGESGAVIVCGSLYLAGPVRKLLLK